jgi:hypothetical protein
MGTKGVGHEEFKREIHTGPHQPMAIPGIDDRDLEIFVQDVLFNFALEQALDSLEDPGALAEVARLRTLVARIPVYADLAQKFRGLWEAIHEFQAHFNEQAEQTAIQFEATKHRMVAARLRSRTQAALENLAYGCELQGRFYCPPLPGLVENPRRYYDRPLPIAQTITEQGIELGREKESDGGFKRHGCASHDYRAMQCAINVCRLCGNPSHWIRECEQPHNGCRGPYCELRRDHPMFDFQRCVFQKRQVGQRGTGKRKRDKEGEEEDLTKRQKIEDEVDERMMEEDELDDIGDAA